jgi:predicted Zn-dependent protease
MQDTERDAVALLAYFYLQNARPERAAVLYAALDAASAGDRKTLTALALAQLRAGRPDQALSTLDRMAMQGGIDLWFHLLRAQAQMALQRPKEAAASMRAFVAARRESAHAPAVA